MHNNDLPVFVPPVMIQAPVVLAACSRPWWQTRFSFGCRSKLAMPPWTEMTSLGSSRDHCCWRRCMMRSGRVSHDNRMYCHNKYKCTMDQELQRIQRANDIAHTWQQAGIWWTLLHMPQWAAGGRHGRRLASPRSNRKSDSISRCVFAWRTVLPNFNPVPFETTQP